MSASSSGARAVDDWEDRNPRATSDAATALPFLAAVLLLPPVILSSPRPAAPLGVPLIVVYVFARLGGDHPRGLPAGAAARSGTPATAQRPTATA